MNAVILPHLDSQETVLLLGVSGKYNTGFIRSGPFLTYYRMSSYTRTLLLRSILILYVFHYTPFQLASLWLEEKHSLSALLMSSTYRAVDSSLDPKILDPIATTPQNTASFACLRGSGCLIGLAAESPLDEMAGDNTSSIPSVTLLSDVRGTKRLKSRRYVARKKFST